MTFFNKKDILNFYQSCFYSVAKKFNYYQSCQINKLSLSKKAIIKSMKDFTLKNCLQLKKLHFNFKFLAKKFKSHIKEISIIFDIIINNFNLFLSVQVIYK